MTCRELLEMLDEEGVYSCSTLTDFLTEWAKNSTPIRYEWMGPYLSPDSCGVALLFCDDGILDIPWRELVPNEGYEQLMLEEACIHVDPQSSEFQAVTEAISEEIRRLQGVNWEITQLLARLGRAREEVSDSG